MGGADGASQDSRGAGLLPALASATYKGVLFSVSSQPGWRDARWLGGYFTSSALVLGCAVLLVLAILRGQDQAKAVLRPALALLTVCGALPLFLLLVELHRSLSRAYAVAPRTWMLCGAGVAAPPLLCLLPGDLSSLGAALVVLLAAAYLRDAIVRLPQDIHGPAGPPGTSYEYPRTAGKA